MPVNYYLRSNELTKDEDDHIAVVKSRDHADLNHLVERILEGGSSLARGDVIGVMEEFQRALIALLSEGYSVATLFAVFSSSIRGVFNGVSDTFDPARHNLVPNVNPGKRLKFNPDDKVVGIYYIDGEGGETKVETVARSKPSLVIFLAPPSLKNGEYNVGIRTKSGKNLKMATYNKKLRVN